MRSEWRETTFSALIINHDKKRHPLSSRQREQRQGNYPYYGAQGIIDYLDDYIFDGEYLLIAEDGENLNSKKNPIAQIAKGKFWVNNHAHIIEANETSNLHFLHYLVNSIDISSYVTGSAQPKLSQSSMNAIRCKVPPLPEQRAIAATLSCLDDKIELNNKINANLEAQAQAIFKSWFVDFEPFQDGEFVDSELGRIPKGWRVGKFTEIINVLGGGTPNTGNPEYWNGKIPFFTPKDVNNLYTLTTEKYLTKTGLENCNSRIYPVNTVFITARGTVGKIALTGVNMAMNQSCYALTGVKGYNQFYVYGIAKKVVESLRHKSSGAVFNAIVTRDFSSEYIAIPTLDVVKEYERIVSPLFQNILVNSVENDSLAALRDTLLPKLMNGEIEVPVNEEASQ